MTTAVQAQLRRGTDAQVAAFTGAAGEVTPAMTTFALVLHDGTTVGGHRQATEAYVQAALMLAPPQGRLTLTSGTAITTSDVTGATTIYYTPAGGAMVPIYNGTLFVATAFSQLSMALDGNSGDAGYHQSGNAFDLFVFNNNGVVTLGTGPAWSSSSSRATGAGTTQLQLVNGIWTNDISIALRFGSSSGNTVSVAANHATYVGSFYASANGQATDSIIKRWLWNAYNQAPRTMAVTDPAVDWTYSTATYRQANANTANQLDMLIGLAGVAVHADALSVVGSSTSTFRNVFTGIGVNSTTANSAQLLDYTQVNNSQTGWSTRGTYDGYPGMGRVFLAWLEMGQGDDTQTWYSATANPFVAGISGRVLG